MSNEMMQKLLNYEDTTRVKVRFNDTDTMGIVHFKNYLVYFDDGFVSFMNKILAPKRIEETVRQGTVFGVKKVSITYENTAAFGDYVLVKTKILKIGKSSITFHHELFRESDHALLATVEAVRLALELHSNKLLSVIDFFSEYI